MDGAGHYNHVPIFYEQEKRKSFHTAIVRVEQFYPFPEWNLFNILGSYTRVKEICWVQEEPQNMGAWHFINRHLSRTFSAGCEFRYVGKPESASPATGSFKIYRKEQDALVKAAFE
jgi:2-oxoglutarate dehydrogenase complex dehydrogenase (E1) component-like enzyme